MITVKIISLQFLLKWLVISYVLHELLLRLVFVSMLFDTNQYLIVKRTFCSLEACMTIQKNRTVLSPIFLCSINVLAGDPKYFKGAANNYYFTVRALCFS